MKCIMSGSDLAILQVDIFFLYCRVIVFSRCFKGQLISKANWRTIDFLKKQTDDFFCFLFYSLRQTNQIC